MGAWMDVCYSCTQTLLNECGQKDNVQKKACVNGTYNCEIKWKILCLNVVAGIILK